jgi:hypothetical protein
MRGKLVGENLDMTVPQLGQLAFCPLRMAPQVWQIRISKLGLLLAAVTNATAYEQTCPCGGDLNRV